MEALRSIAARFRSLPANVRENVAGGAILFLLLNLTLAPFVWGDRTLESNVVAANSLYGTGAHFPRAHANVAVPLLDPCAASCQTEAEFPLERRIEFGEHDAPLWNPYSAYGTPLAANMQSQPYFPLAWVAVASGTPRGYDWFILLRLYVAGLFAFLFLRRYVALVPALAGGISYMYAGYLWLFLTHPQTSVDALLPALLCAVDRVLDRPRAGTAVLLAAAVALSVVAGMPESTFVAMLLAYGYGAYRLIRERGAGLASRLLHGAAGTALGLAASALQLFPFLAYVAEAHNRHLGVPIGLLAEQFHASTLALYLAPLMHGPPLQGIFGKQTSLHGFFGMTAAFFALVAVLGRVDDAIARRRVARDVVPFFAAAAALYLAKRFGFVAVNWLGALPAFSAVNLYKYDESALACSVAVLAAVGIARVSERRAAPWVWRTAVLVPAAVFTASAAADAGALAAVTAQLQYYYASLIGAFCFLACAIGLTMLAAAGRISTARAAAAAAALVLVELHAVFIVPLFYVANEQPLQAESALYGAPYVRFLQDHLDGGRFYAEDAILQPEWSAAFGIADVRGLDALYPARYLSFVSAFFPDDLRGNFVLHFEGGPLDYSTELQRRFLALSSVRYVGAYATRIADVRTDMLGAALGAHPELEGASMRAGLFAIGGEAKYGVFMAAGNALSVPVRVPAGATSLRFSVAMLPETWEGHDPCGEGVAFRITVRDRGRTADVFAKYIDPKHDPSLRRWVDGTVSLRPYRSRDVQLLLSTELGPSKNGCWSWAAWGGMRIDTEHGAPPAERGAFTLAFQQPGASIFAYRDALPRVAVYGRARVVDGGRDALTALTDPHFDPRSEAVVERGPAPPPALGGAAYPVRAGTLEVYRSRYVRAAVDVPASGDALVVLNDTAYPGWNAYVDGRAVPVLTANYLFRGVVVPPGKHVLEFRFEPMPDRVSLLVSAAALALAALWLAAAALARRRGRVSG